MCHSLPVARAVTDATERLARRLARERKARAEAEAIAERATRELYDLIVAVNASRQALERKVAEDRAVGDVLERINAGIRAQEVFEHVYTSFYGLLPYDRAAIALIEGSGAVRSVWVRAEYARVQLGPGIAAGLKGSSLQTIIDTGRPRVINDLAAHFAGRPISESSRLILDEGIAANLTCPLVAEGKPIGFLFFSSRTPDVYEASHVELLMRVAGQLAVAIEKGRLYDELLEARAQRERFLGMAVHDLRNPLTAITAYLSVLTSGAAGPLTDRQSKALGRMQKASRSLVGLVDDLLDISAVESGLLDLNIEPIDMGALIAEALDAHDVLAAAKSIALVSELGPELESIPADPIRIGQVLANLLSNAIKFSHANTQVTVTAVFDAQYLVVSVADQGQGIAAAELARVFEPFSRAKGVAPTAGEPSSGLGLAIARRIMSAHKGWIRAESQPGRGSTFSFGLPR